jgi:hypothetical protein
MRFRPANISLINRRHYLPRLLLILSSKRQMQKPPQRFEDVDRVTPYQGRVACGNGVGLHHGPFSKLPDAARVLAAAPPIVRIYHASLRYPLERHRSGSRRQGLQPRSAATLGDWFHLHADASRTKRRRADADSSAGGTRRAAPTRLAAGALESRRGLIRRGAADGPAVSARTALVVKCRSSPGVRAAFPVGVPCGRTDRRRIRGNRLDGICDAASPGPSAPRYGGIVARPCLGALARARRIAPELQDNGRLLDIVVRNSLSRDPDALPNIDDMGLCEHAERSDGGADARQLHGLAPCSLSHDFAGAEPGLAIGVCRHALARGCGGSPKTGASGCCERRGFRVIGAIQPKRT